MKVKKNNVENSNIKKLGSWKFVLLFFVIMLVCTVVSRAADSVTIPKVTVETPGSGSLTFKLSGEGKITASSEELVFIPSGGKVLMMANPGTQVNAGDPLVIFDMQDLSENIETLKAEIKKLEIGVEQEKINGEPVAADPDDAAAVENNIRQKKLSLLAIKSMKIDIDEKKKELKRFEELSANEGKFLSGISGTVTETTAAIGSLSSGLEYFKLGNGNTCMIADISQKDSEGLDEQNTSVTVNAAGGKDTVNARVVSIIEKKQSDKLDLSQEISNDSNSVDASEKLLEMTIELEQNEWHIGDKVQYNIERHSGDYKCLVPVSAIREDSKGRYVLIIEEKNSVLGREIIASRVEVKVLNKNESDAAVESALTKDDKIIISSIKVIKAGDRVRIE